jgi:MFS family permease
MISCQLLRRHLRAPSPTKVITVRTIHVFGWLTGALFFLYAWVLRVAPSIMIDEMMRDLAVGAALVGNLSAFYFYGYAGMQVPVGMLIDRFGPRRLMACAALVCAGGCVLFAQSTGYWGVAAGRFVIGASAAFSFVGAMSVAALWFPANRFALLSGLAMMMGMAGGVAGQAPLRLLVDRLDWRGAVLFLAAGGIIIAIAAWLSVRDRPREPRKASRMFSGLGQVAGNSQTWLIALAGLGTTAPLLGFAGLWGVPYLVSVYGLDRASAAAVTSMMFIGWGAGAPLMGWYSDHIGRRREPFIAGLFLCALALMAIVYVPALPIGVMMALCFACGFGGSSQIVGFAAAREHNPVAVSATTLGFVNGMVTGAGALYQPLVGWILDLQWRGETSGGARVYDADAYQNALAVLVAGSLTGFLCTLFVRETECRPQADETDINAEPTQQAR